jgi:hypothetical protein
VVYRPVHCTALQSTSADHHERAPSQDG